MLSRNRQRMNMPQVCLDPRLLIHRRMNHPRTSRELGVHRGRASCPAAGVGREHKLDKMKLMFSGALLWE